MISSLGRLAISTVTRPDEPSPLMGRIRLHGWAGDDPDQALEGSAVAALVRDAEPISTEVTIAPHPVSAPVPLS